MYLDETWVNQNHTVGKCWTDTASKQATGVKSPTGKESHLIILHAGTRNGFVDNTELMFQAKNDGDYHNQMNSAVFENWFKYQLLPNIADNSVIVTDNASYHSVQLEKKPSTVYNLQHPSSLVSHILYSPPSQGHNFSKITARGQQDCSEQRSGCPCTWYLISSIEEVSNRKGK